MPKKSYFQTLGPRVYLRHLSSRRLLKSFPFSLRCSEEFSDKIDTRYQFYLALPLSYSGKIIYQMPKKSYFQTLGPRVYLRHLSSRRLLKSFPFSLRCSEEFSDKIDTLYQFYLALPLSYSGIMMNHQCERQHTQSFYKNQARFYIFYKIFQKAIFFYCIEKPNTKLLSFF